MFRFVCSAIVGFALISASPSLAEETPASPAVAGAASAPVADKPATQVATATPASTTKEGAAQPAPPASPTLTAHIDLAQQRMVVTENGVEKFIWPISSGTAQFPTPRGTFRPEWTSKMWYSRKYDWAPMPHAVFINGGVAVHATTHTGALGSPASHGCIRLAPANAKTFYNLVHRHGLKLTQVSVYGTPKTSGPVYASRKPKRAPQVAVAQQNDFWFFGYSPTNYESSPYNPTFSKKRATNVKPGRYGYGAAAQPRVILRKGGTKVVSAQPPKAY
ncbi:MAG: L,D-transpeptidase [Hyphomicrobium sp.]